MARLLWLPLIMQSSARSIAASKLRSLIITSVPLLMNKPISAGFSSRLAVTYRAVGDLIPDPRNARTHSKRQIEQIRASIEAFGFTNPILADPEGHIIAGHGRLQAARAMGVC